MKENLSTTVCIDFDGTLANNKELSIASTIYGFEKALGVVLDKDKEDLLNIRFSEAIPRILLENNMDFDLNKLQKAVNEVLKHKREFGSSSENYHLMELALGTHEMLQYLKKNEHLVAVVSNGYKLNIELMMKELRIFQWVDYVHAESNTRFQKPRYIPILHAMRELADQSGIAFRDFVKNPSIMVGDTLKNDQVATQNYNRFVNLINPDSHPMDFALVDLNDPESNNSHRYGNINYLGGNLRDLRIFL
jgi:phosphoglycolate phosphatase-like HAD superfamily hydrolase